MSLPAPHRLLPPCAACHTPAMHTIPPAWCPPQPSDAACCVPPPCWHPAFEEVFFDRKVQLQQRASAQETISLINALGPELDTGGPDVPSAPIPDFSGVAKVLQLNRSMLADTVAKVGGGRMLRLAAQQGLLLCGSRLHPCTHADNALAPARPLKG